MTKIQYLKHQADKADRLARDVSDSLTVARLASFSREYRDHAKVLETEAFEGEQSESAATDGR